MTVQHVAFLDHGLDGQLTFLAFKASNIFLYECFNSFVKIVVYFTCMKDLLVDSEHILQLSHSNLKLIVRSDVVVDGVVHHLKRKLSSQSLFLNKP